MLGHRVSMYAKWNKVPIEDKTLSDQVYATKGQIGRL